MGSGPLDVRDSIAYVLHRYARLQRRHFLALTEGLGADLSQESWFILNRLYVEGPRSQTELTDEIFADRPNITRMIVSLERKRLVRRRQDPEDGRRMICSLTTIGRALHERVAATIRAERARLFAGLDPDDVAALRRVLAHMEKRILST